MSPNPTFLQVLTLRPLPLASYPQIQRAPPRPQETRYFGHEVPKGSWEGLKEETCGRYQAGSAQWITEAQLQVPGELGH